MKSNTLLAASFVWFCLSSASFGGENVALEAKDKPAEEPLLDAMTPPLNSLNAETSYVFGSPLKDSGASGQPYSKQDEFEGQFSYLRRIPLGAPANHLYLDLGGSYSRFDFGETNAQVPSTLQSIAGTVGFEYVIGGRFAISLRSNPGVYFSGSHITARAFDAPTFLTVAVPLRPTFKLFLGVGGSALSKYPVLPVGGFIWNITPKLTANIAFPAPRLIYSFNDRISLFVGGGGSGGSFVRDDTDAVRGRIDHTVLFYTDYRAGAGLTVKVVKGVSLDLSGGYDIQRKFDYYRPGINYRTKDGEPYAGLNLRAEF